MKPKYLRVCSDLHLEQYYGTDPVKLSVKFVPEVEKDLESILILAGDISSKPDQLIPFLATLTRFMKVVYIPGNHEYYGHEFYDWESRVMAAIESLHNVTCPGNDVKHEELDNCHLIFGTMWADGGNSVQEQYLVNQGLYDFYMTQINDNGHRPWTVHDMMSVHKKQKTEIKALCEQHTGDKPVIVATHHMPSYRLCHPRFGTEINGGFASNCEDILAYDFAPTVWIHGHTHDTIDTQLWKTRIICNPSGYKREDMSGFNHYTAGPVFIEI